MIVYDNKLQSQHIYFSVDKLKEKDKTKQHISTSQLKPVCQNTLQVTSDCIQRTVLKITMGTTDVEIQDYEDSKSTKHTYGSAKLLRNVPNFKQMFLMETHKNKIN